ncbi:MAG: hypothetical protein GY754_14845 [bacterium]|nr:hypothetical protein [bacterium]
MVFSLASAQEIPDDIGKWKNYSLAELMDIEVIAASKIGKKIYESPAIISVITDKDIRQYGWTSINDIMYHMPGFTQCQDYDRRTIAARGMFEGWKWFEARARPCTDPMP